MRDLFVSYSNEDFDIVSNIVERFRFFNISCWFQLDDCRQQFTKAIVDGLNGSSNFVVFVSKNSIKSNYVLNEIYMAANKNSSDRSFHIIPVILDDVDIENSEEFQEIKILIGRFNFVFLRKYATIDELILKIIDQAQIDRSFDEGVNSIYDCTTDIEKTRIDAQNRFLNRIANKYLDELFDVLDKPVVLDIGCSDGDNIMRRLSGREYSKLVGVDNNDVALQNAESKYADGKNIFCHVDITDDSFETKLQEIINDAGIESFDLIHISAVLLHTKNPGEILRIAGKFLRKDGYIFIQDEDDGVNLAYPNSEFFDSCFYLYQHSKESGDRHMARKLPLLLKQNGYYDMSLKSTSISSIDFNGEEKETLWDMYFNPAFWNASEAKFFDSIKSVDALKKVYEQHDSQKAAYMSGNCFVMLGIFFFTAKKK